MRCLIPFGCSCCPGVELESLVVWTSKEYTEVAQQLAGRTSTAASTSAVVRLAMRRQLRRMRWGLLPAPLFDVGNWTTQLERAVAAMVETRQAQPCAGVVGTAGEQKGERRSRGRWPRR